MSKKYLWQRFITVTIYYPLMAALGINIAILSENLTDLILVLAANIVLVFISGTIIYVTYVMAMLVYSWLFLNSLVYFFGIEKLIVRSGVIFKNVDTIPYSRVTQVIVKQNPIEMLLGLYSIQISTAGSITATQGDAGQSTAQISSVATRIRGVRKKDMENIVNYITSKITRKIEPEVELWLNIVGQLERMIKTI